MVCRWWWEFSSLHSVVSDSLQPHELQHARPPCPSPTPGVHSNSHSSSQWCHPAISSSVVPFSSCPQSLPASESFPMSQLFTWGGFSFSIIPSKEHTGLISFRMDWLDLLAVQETQESSPTPQFKIINSLALSFLHSPTLTLIHDFKTLLFDSVNSRILKVYIPYFIIFYYFPETSVVFKCKSFLVSLWNKSKYVSCQNKAKCNTVLRNFIIANSDVWSTQANKIHKHILIIQKQWATGKLPQSLESFPLPWSLKVLQTLKQIYYSTWPGKKTNHFFFFEKLKQIRKWKLCSLSCIYVTEQDPMGPSPIVSALAPLWR